MISNLAYVHPDAVIGSNVTVEPFAYIEGDVVIGDDCWIGPHTAIYDGARIGKGNRIHPGASIACQPQDLKFAGEKSTAVIGDYNDIREYVTISRGTASRGTTVVGSHNLLMAYVHVAHDDVLGSHCVLANRTSLAGEVEVGDWVVIGGHTAVHQWVHIGDHAMIQGGALIGQDIPPYIIVTNGESHYADPRHVPHTVPERAELPYRLRQGRGRDSAFARTRCAGKIRPLFAARRGQALFAENEIDRKM